MSRKHTIEMLVYTHPWSLHLLGKEGIIDSNKKTLLFEVSQEPNLAIVCPDPEAKSLGSLPLLRQPNKLKLASLAKKYPMIDAPLVLAPNPQRPLQLIIDSLRVLDSKEDECEHIILLCHMHSLALFKQLFPICDQFSILWDAADYPSTELLDCASLLKDSGCLTAERWNGFKVCNHWLRSTEAYEENKAIVTQALSAAGI